MRQVERPRPCARIRHRRRCTAHRAARRATGDHHRHAQPSRRSPPCDSDPPSRRFHGRLDADVASHTEIVTTTKRGGLAAGWGWLKGELAGEVKRQTEIERHATLVDKTDALAKVLELITHDDLQPVLVFDDTDRWLSNGGPALMRSFFSEGVRWLLELPASLVVAVHPHYFTDLPQQQLLQYIDTQITIPQITNPAGIEAILARRIELYADTDKPHDALDAAYSTSRSSTSRLQPTQDEGVGQRSSAVRRSVPPDRRPYSRPILWTSFFETVRRSVRRWGYEMPSGETLRVLVRLSEWFGSELVMKMS
jgi:hypothetical protein